MTGKPSYQANEIQFALELMLQDLYNEQISDAFDQRFGRPLTDNQIRYLRNKYGKDPDFGAPLVNRPASKKLKRRRAEAPEPPRPEKRARREVPTATEPVTPAEVAPSPAIDHQQLKLLQESHNPPPSSTVAETITFKKEVVDSPTPSNAYVVSPGPPAFTLPGAAQVPEGGYIPRTAAGLFPQQQQQHPTWNTNFHPINTNFGQNWVASPVEETPGLSTTPTPTPTVMSPNQQACFFPGAVPQYRPHNIQHYRQELLFQPVDVQAMASSQAGNTPQPAEVVQTGLTLPQTDEEAAPQQTVNPEEFNWVNVRTIRQADNQLPLISELTQDVATVDLPANSIGKWRSYSQQQTPDSPQTPQNLNRSLPQQPFTNYTHQTPSTSTRNTDTIDPRLFEKSP
ncbi:hypothetical protein CDV31_002234 [Fusarium ambrosium]|uniref:Uncharacterized protein n=1 Tax=Fusarium ambrosium TaxID=131363 RepID=A0A428UXB7_9HYPO|nr:hypothetical protein CDV31_002234 [Fusarium ambrosium]